jgi:hypothetical protein
LKMPRHAFLRTCFIVWSRRLWKREYLCFRITRPWRTGLE